MSVRPNSRARLLQLSDSDIAQIARRARAVGEVWARYAKVSADLLRQGRPQATRAVRTNITRSSGRFEEAFASLGLMEMRRLIAELDDAPDDEALTVATAAVSSFGSDGGRSFIECLATSDTDIAQEISTRLDDLLGSLDDAEQIWNAHRNGRATDERADDEPADHVSATIITDPSYVAEQAAMLLETGTHVAELLRIAADNISQGRPADPINPSADVWSVDARALLAGAKDLADVSDLVALREVVEQIAASRDAEFDRARETLKAVAALHDSGLPDSVVGDFISSRGYASAEEVYAVLQHSAPAGLGGLDETGSSDPVDTDTTHESAPSQFTDESIPGTDVPTAADDDVAQPAPSPQPEASPDETGAPHPEPPLGAEEKSEPPALEEDEERSPQASGPPAVRDSQNSLATKVTSERLAASDPTPAAGPQSDAPEPVEIAELAGERPPSQLREPVTQSDGAVMCEITIPAAGSAHAGVPDFPWDEGAPPVIAALLASGREALACHVADVAGESDIRRRLLRYHAAATYCLPEVLELAMPDLFPTDSEMATLPTDEARVLATAAIRTAVTLGYAPVGLSSVVDRAELPNGPLGSAISTVAEAAQRGFSRKRGNSIGEMPDLSDRWTSIGYEARSLHAKLASHNIKHARSTRVLHHLVRDSQPLGRALVAVAELSEAGIPAGSDDVAWAAVLAAAESLSDRERIIQDADREVSTNQQRREPIVANGRERLLLSIQNVEDLVKRLASLRIQVQASGDPGDLATAQRVAAAISDIGVLPSLMTVGDATLYSLIHWLQSSEDPQVHPSLDDLLDQALLPLYELPRDAAQRPTREPFAPEVAELLTGRDQHAILDGYLARGNVDAARRGLAAYQIEPTAELDDRVLRASQAALRKHRHLVARADRVAARLRSLNRDEIAREIGQRTDALRDPIADRFDLTISPLSSVVEEGEAALEVERQSLRETTLSTDCSDADRARIMALITDGDETLAIEFLTAVATGRPLPPPEYEHGDDFTAFFPAVVDVAQKATATGAPAIAAVREFLGANEPPTDRQLRMGLDDWKVIKQERRGRGDLSFRAALANVLRMIGLVPRPNNWIRDTTKTHERSGFASFRVMAAPVDRSYVPSLGTQAHGVYDVTLVWDRATPARLMDFIEERNRTHPNIILYFNFLSREQRLEVRRHTLPDRGKGFSPLVVDEAVAGWLSTRQEAGWRFTQRVTLPFTTLNPYTPFAGGEVPDEVFVGRADERRRVEDPSGPMFVYGGRQLGKSALLRRVERMFTDPRPSAQAGAAWTARSGNVAVYIDLKAAGIGEALEPAQLWPVLAERLRSADVLSPKMGHGAGVDAVRTQVAKWLELDGSNRLLLLLDESDNFLTADANTRSGPGGRGAFPTLQALKGLMEQSERRFKPVFAGLHQVQRFHDTSNTPVAHGGEDILIGPLGPRDARSLVVDPMLALGYAFESPELVWRLLLVTNYQASLVQIVCEALVRHLQGRPIGDGGGRILITSDDIDTVYRNSDVRKLIAQRFRWTINLDNRYRVIALVVALRSIEGQPGETYDVDEIHDECEVFWPIGFSRGDLSGKEFSRYLEEMVGLGVLHRQDNRYGLRSPSIIGMLGSSEELNRELDEASRHLELEYDYNPTMNRQIVGGSTTLWAPRSPLSDHDLAQVLNDESSRIKLVAGTTALAIDRVSGALRDAASTADIEWLMVDGQDLKKFAGRTQTSRLHLIATLYDTDESADDILALARKIRSIRRTTATIIIDPGQVPKNQADTPPVIHLRRWSVAGLRAWHESPFHTPALRERLHRVTSGWPKLVEQAMRAFSEGKAAEDALDAVVLSLESADASLRFIQDCRVSVETAVKFATWLSQTSEDGLVEATPASLADISVALEQDADDVIAQLQRLDVIEQSDRGWIVDRVLIAAAARLDA